ncbi:hypothetical protein Tco_1443568 [Tanacetum coccineum]
MMDYGYNFMQTKIHVDNESAICVIKNPIYHSKTKHIEIRHHFIRDSYEKRLIEMVKIHIDNNVADLLTKAFDLEGKHDDQLLNTVGLSFYYLKKLCTTAPEGEGLATPPEPQPTPSTTQPVFHELQIEAHIKQLLPFSTTYQRKRKTQKRRRTKKDTQLPQTSVPQDLGADEAVHKEGVTGMDTGGSPRRQDTIGGAPAQTRSERVLEKPNEPPLSEGHTSGSGEGRMEHQFELTANVPITSHDSPLPRGYTPRSDEGRLKLQELMTMCIKLSKQVIDLEKEKDAQAVEILRLKKRVKRFKRQRKSSTSQPRRKKYRQVESPNDDLNEEDASKQGRIEKKYPLIKKLLEKMLNLQLEAEEVSTMAFELIKFIKSKLEK